MNPTQIPPEPLENPVKTETRLIREETNKKRRKKRLLAIAGIISIMIAFVIVPTAITTFRIAMVAIATFIGLLLINKAIFMNVSWERVRSHCGLFFYFIQISHRNCFANSSFYFEVSFMLYVGAGRDPPLPLQHIKLYEKYYLLKLIRFQINFSASLRNFLE